MKKIILLFSFALIMLPFDAYAKRCGRYACLEFSDYGSRGYKEIKIRNKTDKTLACFIRYENAIFTELVTSSSSPYYLKPYYPSGSVSYRCDIQDEGCHPLLVSRGLCKKT